MTRKHMLVFDHGTWVSPKWGPQIQGFWSCLLWQMPFRECSPRPGTISIISHFVDQITNCSWIKAHQILPFFIVQSHEIPIFWWWNPTKLSFSHGKSPFFAWLNLPFFEDHRWTAHFYAPPKSARRAFFQVSTSSLSGVRLSDAEQRKEPFGGCIVSINHDR